MTRQKTQTQHHISNKDSEGGRLDRGLAFLFGREALRLSKRMTVEAMSDEAELVAEGARQLSENANNPEIQQRIARAMGVDTAAALCKWIREPGRVSALITRSVN